MGMGRGLGRGAGWGGGGQAMPSSPAGPPAPEAPTSRQEEIAVLRQTADELRRQLSEVVTRLEELEEDWVRVVEIEIRSGEEVRVLLDIDRTLCTGCGVCVDACPTGAISLDEEDIPTIDPALCNECLVCLDTCANAAIKPVETSELIPVVEGEIVEGEVRPVSVASLPRPLKRSGLAALTGTALSLVGSWLLPRATDALLDAIERRLAVRSTLSIRSPYSDDRPLTTSGRGGRGGRLRQRRRRRGGWWVRSAIKPAPLSDIISQTEEEWSYAYCYFGSQQ
jgi:ferredoxin